MDSAAVTCGEECDSNCISAHRGSSCYSSKLKADSEQLQGVSAISSIVSSTVGGGSRF